MKTLQHIDYIPTAIWPAIQSASNAFFHTMRKCGVNRLSIVLAMTALTAGSIVPATYTNKAFAAGFSKPKTERQFQNWLRKDMRSIASKAKISKKVYDAAIASITLDWTLPDLAPPGAKTKSGPQKQSEFRAPGRYFNERSIQILVKRGRGQLKKWKRTLNKIEKRYGVSRRIIVAIWGRESGFGRVKMPKNAIRSLATEAFIGRRRALFQKEFLAALKIVASGDIAGKSMGSSWAGALGQPQFLPSKFDQFAVDFDGDGRRDIWRSTPDALASIANYLKQHGWQRGRDWGFEVKIPKGVSCTNGGPDSRQSIATLASMGIKRVSNKPFPSHETKQAGYLLFPAGRFGPTYVTTPNFYVLKKYNESDVYALFVGHLADRMASNKPFNTKWGKLGTLSRNTVRKMQQRLIAKGYDVGGADGFIGYKTRTAIGFWQQANGKQSTCFPVKNRVSKIGR